MSRARYDGVVIAAPVTIPYVRYSTRDAHWFLGRALHALISICGILIMWGMAWVISWYKHSADKGASKTKSTGGNADMAGGGA